MADFMYDNYRAEALVGIRDVSSEVIKLVAVTGSYTATTTHSSINDIPTTARIKTSSAFTNKTTTNGIFDADDVTLTAVTGSAIAALVMYVEAGTSASSTLILFLNSAAQLPVTPNGGDIVVQWDSGSNKIYKL